MEDVQIIAVGDASNGTGTISATVTYTLAGAARAAADAYAASQELNVNLVRNREPATIMSSGGAVLRSGLSSSLPPGLASGAQRAAERFDIERRLAALTSAAAAVISMEDFVVKEADVIKRMLEAAATKKPVAAAGK